MTAHHNNPRLLGDRRYVTLPSAHPPSPLRSAAWAQALGVAAGLVLLLGSQPIQAQGRLDAQYEASLAGIPVGKGAWTIEIHEDQFSAAANGGTSGLMKTFSSGSGTGASQGKVVNGAPVATNYAAS